MGKSAVFCAVMVAMLFLFSTTMAAPDVKKTCTEYGQPCQKKDDCCGGCCQQGQCAPFSEACVSPADPCRLHQCPPPKTCYLQNVECLQSPCHPIPACKDADYDYI